MPEVHAFRQSRASSFFDGCSLMRALYQLTRQSWTPCVSHGDRATGWPGPAASPSEDAAQSASPKVPGVSSRGCRRWPSRCNTPEPDDTRSLSSFTALGRHLGVQVLVAEHVQVLEWVDVALDEGRGVSAADQPHIAANEFPPVLTEVWEVAPVHLALSPCAVWKSIVASGSRRAAGDAYAALSSIICPYGRERRPCGAMPRGCAGLPTPAGRCAPCGRPPESVAEFKLLDGRGLVPIASGDFRYPLTVCPEKSTSLAMSRIPCPAAFRPQISSVLPSSATLWCTSGKTTQVVTPASVGIPTCYIFTVQSCW